MNFDNRTFFVARPRKQPAFMQREIRCESGVGVTLPFPRR